jgi:hypothetical protein
MDYWWTKCGFCAPFEGTSCFDGDWACTLEWWRQVSLLCSFGFSILCMQVCWGEMIN